MARPTPAKKRPPRTDAERSRTKTHTKERGPDPVADPARPKGPNGPSGPSGPKEDAEEWRVRAAGEEPLDERDE